MGAAEASHAHEKSHSFFYSNETLDDIENIDIAPLADVDGDITQLQDVDDYQTGFNPYKFIATLPEKPQNQNMESILPCSQYPDRLTLVLDLDESLVHATLEKVEDAEIIFNLKDENEMDHTIYVLKRPGLDDFLKKVSEIFEVIIFTASQQIYAETLLNIIDPQSYIHHRLYRDSCINVEGNYLKDLSNLGRDISKIVIVDNSPHVFGYHIDNGIPIIGFFNDKNDRELEKLFPFLESLAHVDNVRPHIRDQYKLYEKVNQYKCK